MIKGNGPVAHLVAFLLLGGIVAACQPRAESMTVAEALAESGPTHESWGTDLLLSENGAARLRLRAAYSAYYESEEGGYLVLSGRMGTDSVRVTAIVFGDRGDTTATVVATNLIWFEDERRMEANGNVLVDGPEGRKLESEHLDWLEAERSLRTDGFAHFSMPGKDLKGYGLIADEGLGNVRLANVTGSVILEDE